ncbi:hypothetical protein C8F04DRAFT_1139529 [Mycena alexandri]|uniref:Uncharacterized protein n=1 Tax=Mycena alexandri TaxID=1745969 RepID=A0AAD6S6T1_9AGAR|nr:hypothetical protein C8F04DRAFT_1139529 [Mycena alexandri]
MSKFTAAVSGFPRDLLPSTCCSGRRRVFRFLPSTMASRNTFSGSTRKCILGIDIGTTYAGMSYCLMEPGRIPEILPVTRFPAQDHVGGDSKVPSVIYYDRAGRVKACGAEALQEGVVEQAIEHRWEKAEWFKLHLGPSTSLPTYPLSLPSLPTTKTALEVFSDFLDYLFHCAKQYIVDSYPSGSALWIELESSMQFVLSHPNGWEGVQQAKMRKAAIRAGLVPDTPHGHARIHFVTEGEASLHFCVMNGLATDPLRLGNGVVIVDAGGGTIDISSYRKIPGAEGDVFEETARPQSVFSGSIWVSSRAHTHLRAKLHGSRYAGDVDHIRDCFDKTTKLRFRRTDLWQYIKFGRPSDKDEALNISNGQLKLSGEIVGGFFRPSLEAILEALANLAPLSPVSSVLLVGGFGASDWLYSELKMRLKYLGLDVSRPDSHVNKAVADGAVSFLLHHVVLARVSQHTYGIECLTRFVANNPEHRGRKPITDAAGDLMLAKMFSPILYKNTRVSETHEYRQHYCKMKDDPTELNSVKIQIRCYRGQDPNPRWTDVDPEQYSVLCTVHADTAKIAQTLPYKFGANGAYYCLDIDVVLSFGLTELKAEITWDEDGIEKRGPAKLIY